MHVSDTAPPGRSPHTPRLRMASTLAQRLRGRRSTSGVLALTCALLLAGVLQAIVASGAPTASASGRWAEINVADTGVVQRTLGQGIVPLSLNGGDDRVRANPASDRVVEVLRVGDGGQVVGSCTGAIVGAGAVLTAAHCLDMDALEAGEEIVVVFTGEDGLSPAGVPYIATAIWTPDAWDSNPTDENDYALLAIGGDAIGWDTGWATLTASSDATLGDTAQPTAWGYPIAKGEATQWKTSAAAFTTIGSSWLTAPLDTTEGQDGSPVMLGDSWSMVGLLADSSSDQAGILRVTRGLINALNSACADFGCQLSWVDEAGGSGEPTPDEPTPTPTDPGNGGDEPVVAPPGDNSPFERTWARTDKPVSDSVVSRTWMWGPQANSPALLEAYTQAPDGQRRVIYYDKSRMEITNPSGDANSVWYVTNGLLVVELMTGQMQTGDNDFETRTPAEINVAGDQGDPNGPTYATFAGLRDLPAATNGAAITQRVARDGSVTNDPALAAQGVTAAQLVSEPGIEHQVASPFWAFMNASGTVWQNDGFTQDQLFQSPYYATGYPITEAYWATVEVDGTPRDVLMQCFERRCLTYTPGNDAAWQVEAGNVGQHYYLWRYGDN